MPAPNDLTPEEQQMFSQGGLPDLGPGREPVADDGQQQPESPQQQAEPPQQHTDRRPNGQFKSKEELEAEAAAVAQQPLEGQQPEGQQQEPKMVPLAALHEARQKGAEASRQAQMLSARMNALLMAQQQQQPAQQQMPDINADPAGYIQALEGRLQQFEQQWSQTNEERQLDQALTQDEQLFATTQPDYDVASDYYVQSRARELLQFHPPEQAREIMLAEAREIAKQSWQRGMSPAQTVYNLAAARGYQPGAPQPQPQQGQPQPQGQQQQRGPNPADQVRAITSGQQASRSLSGGGSGATQALNAEAILSMSDDEFEKYLALGQKGANDRFAQIA